MDRSLRIEFDQVDQTNDPADFVRYLDTTRASDFFQEIKQRSYRLLDLNLGDAVCDLGCGTGDDVLALARLVGPSGRAVGVDASRTMLDEASRRASAAGIAAEFHQMDVQHLDFADASFDGVRAERLLQHVADPYAAQSEIVRIAKPGARIVIWEADLDLFVIDAPDYKTSQIMTRFIRDGFKQGGIGHELYRRFLDLGLVDVQATPLMRELTNLEQVEDPFDLSASIRRAVDAGLLSSQQAGDWMEYLVRADAAGRFYAAVGGFLASGTKPRP